MRKRFTSRFLRPFAAAITSISLVFLAGVPRAGAIDVAGGLTIPEAPGAARGGMGSDAARLNGRILKDLNNSQAWRALKAQMGRGWSARWNTVTGAPHMATGRAAALPGFGKLSRENVESACLDFVDRHSDLLRVKPGQLRSASAVKGGGRWYVDFQQTHNGIPVIGGRVHMSFTKDDHLIAFGSDVFPDVAVDTNPRIDAARALDIVQADLPETRDARFSPPQLSILPLRKEADYDYILCWSIDAAQPRAHKSWRYLVDAGTGAILAKWDTIRHATASGTVQGAYVPEFPDDPPAVSALPHNQVQAQGPETAIQTWSLDFDPVWTMQGQWAYGVPTGSGGGQHGLADPAAGYTGSKVLGVNLNGDYYSTVGGPWWLTTDALDCVGRTSVWLKFRRWLNTDYRPAASATVEVSNNGTTWTPVWSNAGSTIIDSNWTLCRYDISSVAANMPNVYLRWGYQVEAGTWMYSGWNIDDVALVSYSGGIYTSVTGTDGAYTVELPWNPSSIYSELKGPYCEMNYAGGSPDAQFTQAGVMPGNQVDWTWDAGLYNQIDESSVFRHVNYIHDYYKQIDPGFSGMDYQVPTTVSIPGLNDAYWDGTGLAFGAGDGITYADFGLSSEMIYHEYTHGVTDKIYQGVQMPNYPEFGALQEGLSDYFGCALSLSQSPEFGDGLLLYDPNGIRTLDNTFRRETDWTGEAHADSQMFSGGLWEARQSVGAGIMDLLTHFTRYAHPAGYEDYVLDLVIEDDTRYGDDDITNGCPHGQAIYTAFGNHGIGGLQYLGPSIVIGDAGGIVENGRLEPGEAANLSLTLTNGWADATNVTATLSCADPLITMWKSGSVFGNIGQGATLDNLADPFVVELSASCPETRTIYFTLDITANGFYAYTRTCKFYYAVAVGQLACDDGGAEGYAAPGPGESYAVKFTPDSYPCYLRKVRLFPGGPSSFDLTFRDDDGPSGAPGTVIRQIPIDVPIGMDWFDIDISSQYLQIDSGSIYVGWTAAVIGYSNGYDLDPPDWGRMWRYDSAAQQWYSAAGGNLMLRLRYSDIPLLKIEPPYDYQLSYAGEPVSDCFIASGGVPPYHDWQAAGLPIGLTLNSETGCLSGMPIAPGSYQALVQVTDSDVTPQTAMHYITFDIVNCSTPAPSGPNPGDNAVGVPLNVGLEWNYSWYIEDFEMGVAQNWSENTEAYWEVYGSGYRAMAGIAGRQMQATYTGESWTDVAVQATMRRSADSGSPAGVFLRATNDFNTASPIGSAYILLIDGAGQYRVAKYVSGSLIALQNWTYSQYLNQGTSPNIVILSAAGTDLDVYVNNHLIWSGSDSSITAGGHIGLYGYSGSSSTGHYYDNVIARQPIPDGASQPVSSTEITLYDVFFGLSPESLAPVAFDVTQGPFYPTSLQAGKTYYWRVTAKSFCGESPGPCWSFTTQASTADAKLAPNGTPVDIHGAIVSGAFADFFYIESDNRASGIRVQKTTHGLVLGDRADVVGTAETNSDGEKYVEATSTARRGAGSVAPTGLRCAGFGGCDFAYNPATGAGQQGVKAYIGGSPTMGLVPGLNNIGLLVRLFGEVSESGRGWFYFDDGSQLGDGTGYVGVYVAPTGLVAPKRGDYVSVTGISSCQFYDSNLVSLLLPRAQSDIVIVVPAQTGLGFSAEPGPSPREGAR
ncbi:MAG: putative Ig domain-containing protein [Armatimonadota bacterium]|nr:putative Ig domain-containing protein [Armatimonadota bacterium]